MATRAITALAAALALLVAAPAVAQDPPEEASRAVERIYDDHGEDLLIGRCDHDREDVEEALDTIEEDVDRDFPEFRDALEVSLRAHDRGACDEPAPDPTAEATVEATAEPLESATPESGSLPPLDDSGGGGGGDDGGAVLPEDGSLPPEDGTLAPESGTVAPEELGAAAQSAPVPPPPPPVTAPPAAATTPLPSPTPVILARSRATDGLLVPGIVLTLAGLGALALAALAVASRRSPRLHHAWREAGLRTRGTWADFSDWLRLGR